MRNIYSLLSIFLLTILIFPLHAEEVNVTGVWEMTTHHMQEDVVSTCKFVQDGEKLLVIRIRRNGEEREPLRGTVKGNKIEWTETANINNEEFEVTYTGTIEGDTITGEMEFCTYHSFDWTAKRKENST